MLPDYYPYIRDVVTINAQLNTFCQRASIGPVFLVGRVVQHEAGCPLRVTANPVIIVADVYDGTNGIIDATATALGGSGGSVTVLCRRSINATVNAAGGYGTTGAPGANGSPGTPGYHSDGYYETVTDPFTGETTEVWHDGVDEPGVDATDGGAGGTGGPGGPGGTITFTSICDDTYPNLSAAGGGGGPGGPGGAAGDPQNAAYDLVGTHEGAQGDWGPAGSDGSVNYTSNIGEADYVSRLRPVLDGSGWPFANYWAPFRIQTGEYFYHLYNPAVPARADYGRLAAIEFERALELQPDNPDAKRLQQQLQGFPPSAGAVWVGGGTNALGLARDLDLLPNFDSYINAFTSFGQLVLDFLALGVTTIVQGQLITELQKFAELQRQQAAAARDSLRADLDIAKTEQQQAGEDVTYAQQQLDQAAMDVTRAVDAMQQQPEEVSIGGILGTVAQIGGAVAGIVAAVPTGGASLVAMAPSMVALASSLLDNAPGVVNAWITSAAADPKVLTDAYNAVNQDPSGAIPGGRSIVNFVTLVQQLSQSTTPKNAQFMAVVQHGTELTHQLLIARNRAVLAEQRVAAGEIRLARADDVVAQAVALRNQLHVDAALVKQAGLLAVATAQSKASALLSLAFRAERSVEIITLKDEQQNLYLDAGLISPDISRAYNEEDIHEGELINYLIASWGAILAPVGLQADYTNYFEKDHDQDWLRLSFKATDQQVADLKTRHEFTFWVDASKMPADRFDTKIKSVRLALVGATHPAGEVSCDIGHGGMYQQRTRDGNNTAVIATQLLKPRVSTRPAPTTPLLPDQGFGDDPPLTAPRSLSYWGRGVGGYWQLAIPQDQFDSGLNLNGLSEVQVWIGYQFVR